MTGDVKRIPLGIGTELTAVAEAVRADKEPRVLEQDGRPIAAVVSMEDLERLRLKGPTPEGIQRALDAAGAWKNLDIDADALIEKIYRWRHESPPSEPVSWCYSRR